MKTRIAPWISDEILDQMFKRLEGIEWYTWVDGEYFPWYLIPKELVITEYRSKSGSCIISKSEDGHIPGNQSWMINDYLHLDQQEYYDLIELHIRFEEDRPKCNNPGCNQYVPWSNRLSSGYGNGRFDVHFCSRSCQLSYKYWQYPDKGIASISSHLKAKRNSFLSSGSRFDDAQFYIGTVDSRLKYGVTTIAYKRKYSRYCENDVEFSNFKVIWRGTRIQVANLEYLIGLTLNQQTEYLEFTNTFDFRSTFNKLISDTNYLTNLKLGDWEIQL